MDAEERLIRLIQTAGIDEVQRIMGSLSRDVREAVLDILDERITEAKKRQAMQRIREHSAEADDAIRAWTREGMGKSYIAGLNTAGAQLINWGIRLDEQLVDFEILEAAPNFGQHRDAVNQLMRESYLDFGNSINGVVRNAEQRINDGLRQQIRAQMTEGRALGTSVQEIARNVREQLDNQGFTALVDRGGRKWSLDSYSEMLTRSHVIKSNNEAQMNRYLEYGVGTVEVSTHNADCSICGPLEGKIYSINGNQDSEYPYLDNPPPFHPNCRHTLLPRPDLEI